MLIVAPFWPFWPFWPVVVIVAVVVVVVVVAVAVAVVACAVAAAGGLALPAPPLLPAAAPALHTCRSPQPLAAGSFELWIKLAVVVPVGSRKKLRG
jgi:hypothetical protein